MSKTRSDSMKSEIENRLDEIFGDDEDETLEETLEETIEETIEETLEEEPDEEDDQSPIKDLKGAILSIEWEISDKTLTRLDDEIKRLGQVFKGDRIVTTFLKLLGSAGGYIQHRKAGAHPKAVNLLHSVFEALEHVLDHPEMPRSEQKAMLQAEVDQFNSLKKNIAVRKKSKKKVAPAKPAAPPPAAEPTISVAETPTIKITPKTIVSESETPTEKKEVPVKTALPYDPEPETEPMTVDVFAEEIVQVTKEPPTDTHKIVNDDLIEQILDRVLPVVRSAIREEFSSLIQELRRMR